VLIVDADPHLRTMLASPGPAHGFAVRQAGDGAAALAELAVATPDCVVLDLMMPEVDGFEVLARMRDGAVAPGAKVVVLSCRGDEAALVRAWELGADEYLVKPTDPDVLVARIGELAGVTLA
jgi:DNA-binding response OmpR family regulator